MNKEAMVKSESTTMLKSMSKAAQARKMREWQAKLSEMPEEREDKIALARQRYAEGFYNDNIDKLSDILLDQ